MSKDKAVILQSFSLSYEQEAAVLARYCDVAVTAGAGTGKTRTLVARYLSLLAEGVPLRQIAALTFTRKAAREMRNRVRSQIDAYLTQGDLDDSEAALWRGYYNDLDAARIGTIHNLCADILRAHPAQVAIDPKFVVLDETEAALLIQDAVESTLGWAAETEGLDLLFSLLRERQLIELLTLFLRKRLATREILGAFDPQRILEHWEQQIKLSRESETTRLLADPAFITAGRLLVENEANTPDDKAEQQRRAVLRALQTLHNGPSEDSADALAVLLGINLVGGSQKSWPGGKEQLQEMKEALRTIREIVKLRKLLTIQINAQDETIAAAIPAIFAAAGKAQQVYADLKRERDALDFDDLEDLAIKLLADHPDVQSYWQSQIQALLVDEFQDTNAHQRKFIRLLCPDAGKLFIVGDGKQSIYRFRGADVSVFAAEKEIIKGQNGRLIDLDVSYRAHEALLVGMNQLLQPVLGEDGPHREFWEAPFSALRAGSKEAQPQLGPPFIEFHLALGNKGKALPAAAGALAEQLSRYHHEQGIDYGAMAILCRASNAFQYYEDALDRAGIPYLTVAGKGFYDRPEIRDLLNALQAIADPHDDLALVGLLRSPACGLSDVTLYHLAKARKINQSFWESLQMESSIGDSEEKKRLEWTVDLVRELNLQAGRLSVAAILTQFLARTTYRAILRRAGEGRALRNVDKLVVDVHDSQLVSLSALLEYIQLRRESGSREGEARSMAGGVVQIMSIHAAKGLEFPLVVLGDAGSSSGGSPGTIFDRDLGILLPVKNDDQIRAGIYEFGVYKEEQQESAERARLLYVALTRAEQVLLISGTGKLVKSGLSWSGWLEELAEICGLNAIEINDYDEDGQGCQSFDLLLQDTAVRVAIYEPNYQPVVAESTVGLLESAAVFSPVKALQDPWIKEKGLEEEEEPAQDRLWHRIGESGTHEALRIAGLLTHRALASWRFPGPGFEEWLREQCKVYRLSAEGQVDEIVKRVIIILRALKQNKLFQEIDSAERRLHELPYSIVTDEGLDNGRIDLLFKDARGWAVVDFKTRSFNNNRSSQNYLKAGEAEEQRLRQYGTAVHKLIGERPRLLICILSYSGGSYVHNVNYEDFAAVQSAPEQLP